MPTSPVVETIPQVRDAFDEACAAVFNAHVQRPLARHESRRLFSGFVSHYQRLCALPRRKRRSIQRRFKRTLSAIALMMTLGQAPAWAAVIAVAPGTPTAIASDGRCSLSEAINNANANAAVYHDCLAGSGTDTIILPANSNQILSGQELLPQINSQIVLEGNGSTIIRDTETRFDSPLTFLAIGPAGNLTLNKTTVSGMVPGRSEGQGQGITSSGRVTLNNSSLVDLGDIGLRNLGGVAILRNSSITDNHGQYENGGGIANLAGGTLTVTDSTVSNNLSQTHTAGGILNDGTATLRNAIVSGNGVSTPGSTHEFDGPGGINNRGSLTIFDSTISDNSGEGNGGGIWNTGTAIVRRSTISGNSTASTYSNSRGGGIENSGTLTLTNSTVSNNGVFNDGYFSGGNGGGAGISNSAGVMTIVNSTVTGNVSFTPDVVLYEDRGGGVAVFGGTLTIQRSIVSGNEGASAPEVLAESGATVNADDFNLFGHNGDAGVAGFTPGATDVVPSKPVSGILLPLADNGGGTPTHALAIGSPALDASPDDATCSATDQRNSPRPQGTACDIGSFEGSAVLCNGKVTTMVGTAGADNLTGTSAADVISGLGGNDIINGLEGNDLVCAGGGADRVYGGSGNDVLFGEGGNDQLFGHGGNDTLNGGTGQDGCDGGLNSDTAAACETVSNVP